METRPYVSWELIGNFMTDTFQAVGVPEEDAKLCADVLMESDRRGIESHGCNRFKPIYIDRIIAGIQKPVTEYEILKETETTAVADAHDGMGMVASHKACLLYTSFYNINDFLRAAVGEHLLGIDGAVERHLVSERIFQIPDIHILR